MGIKILIINNRPFIASSSLQKGKKGGTPQKVIEYKTKMTLAQTSEVFIVEIVRLNKPIRRFA